MKDLAYILTAAALICLTGGTAIEAGNGKPDASFQQMRKQFVNPGNEYRALPMCSFDYGDVQKSITKTIDAGWGGVNFQFPDWGAGYLENPDAWSKFVSAVDLCRKNNLIAWIYDERGYPSGKAGSLVLKDHPEYEAQGLYYASSDYRLPSAQQIEWKIPKGKPFYIALFKLDGSTISGTPVDLTQSAQDGILRAQLEPGNWRVIAFVQGVLYKGTHSDILGERYVNLMDPNVADRFIQVTHQAYYDHAGDDFGKTIKAFFIDEPSLMGGYLKDEVQEYPALSWYDGLPAAFKSDHGYDIRDALPSIFNNTGADTSRKRCDVYRTISRLIAENFFGHIRKWCEAHNVASGGHLLWEESLIYHANFYGNFMTSIAELDLPGIDVLGCAYGNTSGSRTEGGPVTPKLISSTAHLYNRDRTCCESFCFVTKDTPLEDMIAHVAWQWTLGINTLTTLSTQAAHSPDVHRKLNDYTGKLSYMLTQGKFAADVAVLYPIASVWTDFTPTNRGVWNFEDNPKAEIVDASWQGVTRQLLGCQRDFDYVDEKNVEGARISDGAFSIGKCRYSILVMPNVTTLRLTTLKQIDKFVQSGGTVITCGATPSIREDAGPIDEFNKIVSRIWGEKDGKNKIIKLDSPEALYSAMSKIGNADLRVSPKNADIYYQHRILSDGDIYFLLNNSKQPISGNFTFRTAGKAEIWDPMTSKMTPVSPKMVKGFSKVSATIPPRNGIFVVFSR